MTRNQTPILERVDGAPLAQKDWYIFFYNLYLAATGGLPQESEALVIGASPALYTAIIRGQIHIAGGTVSAIEFSRNGINWFNTGQTSGFVQMDATDSLRITYTVVPTVTFFPM